MRAMVASAPGCNTRLRSRSRSRSRSDEGHFDRESRAFVGPAARRRCSCARSPPARWHFDTRAGGVDPDIRERERERKRERAAQPKIKMAHTKCASLRDLAIVSRCIARTKSRDRCRPSRCSSACFVLGSASQTSLRSTCQRYSQSRKPGDVGDVVGDSPSSLGSTGKMISLR